MFITPALAADAAPAPAGGIVEMLIPMLLIFAIMWFFLIRPQQKRMQEHRDMVNSIRKNDTIVSGGGIVAKVVKVGDGDEIEVEVADGTRMKIVRSYISSVRPKNPPKEAK